MKPFRDRNPVPIGIAGTVGIVLALVVAFNFDSLQFLNGSESYTAEFVDASGLHAGDDVQISGVKVGKVSGIGLDDGVVEVEFSATTTDVVLGDRTEAAIKVQTALGRRYLDLEPAGSDVLRPGSTIPRERTRASFDVSTSLSDLTRTVTDTDVPDLSGTLDTAGEVFDQLPADLRGSLEGVNRLSQTVSSRNDELRSLFEHADGVTGVLAERNTQLSQLFTDGQALFTALNERSDTVHSLLLNIRSVSAQLTATVSENREQIGPTLDQLNSIAQLLQNNYDNLNQTLTRAAPFVRQLGESVASGPYFQVIIQNVVPTDLRGQLPNGFGGER